MKGSVKRPAWPTKGARRAPHKKTVVRPRVRIECGKCHHTDTWAHYRHKHSGEALLEWCLPAYGATPTSIPDPCPCPADHVMVRPYRLECRTCGHQIPLSR
jgi:hypothetical protein